MYHFRVNLQKLQIKSNTLGITAGDKNGWQAERRPLGVACNQAG